MLQITDINALFLLVFAIGLLPFVVIVLSSYTKITVVLTLLRNALGVQQAPSGMVINGIALLLSVYIMAPIFVNATQAFQSRAQDPRNAPTQTVLTAFEVAREPFRKFLIKHTKSHERLFFLRSAAVIWPKDQAGQLTAEDLIVVAPAFILSQLTDAFKIGFLLYLTFILIDILVANVLMAMGLNQVNPVNVAIPFKLLLFIAMDGWSSLIHSLVLSYQ